MRMSEQEWIRYRDRLSAVNRRAAELMQEYMDAHGYEVDDAMVEYAWSLATKYGEAAAELSCIMYDDVAEASGESLEPAEPAPTATFSETAKAVRGTAKKSPEQIPATVGQLVKQAGADTTLQNAVRDGAEWAWVPHGDTCAFCITLASRGWQKASKKALKNGHAEHIHAHCDCTYAVRFDGKSSVEGYDPQVYEDMYYGAEGDTPEERINSMRRKLYAKDPEKYLAPKRIAYARKVYLESLRKTGDPIYDIYGPIINSHPEERTRIIRAAEQYGVEIREGRGRMAYSPGLRRGAPGQLIISDDDSIGAWLHEEQHMLDDMSDGFPGFAGLFDIERRATMEYNAYRREIMLALEAGREDIAEQLRQMCREEIEHFGGVWDESKLN